MLAILDIPQSSPESQLRLVFVPSINTLIFHKIYAQANLLIQANIFFYQYDWIQQTIGYTDSTPRPSCNDSTLRFRLTYNGRKISRDCSWVANRSTTERCNVDGVAAICAESCGACDTCDDSTNRFKFEYNNQKIRRSCKWVGNKKTKERCKIVGIKDACRLTCSACDSI